MKTLPLLLAAALLAAISTSAFSAEELGTGAPPENLKDAIQRQVASKEALEAQAIRAEGDLRIWYGNALDLVKKDAVSKGQLDAVLAVDQERERVDRDLTAEEKGKLSGIPLSVRQQYDQAREKLVAQRKASLLASVRAYAATLADLEKRLTRKGEIDEAVATRKERVSAQDQLTAVEPGRIPVAIAPPAVVPAPVAHPAAENLLRNASFEDGQTGWEFNAWKKVGAVSIDTTEKHEGKASLRIENPSGSDSFVSQNVPVKPLTHYRMSGYLKTKDVTMEKGGTGANLAMVGGFQRSEAKTGTNDWTKVSFEFDSGQVESVKVAARLGFYSNMAVGVAWFDELAVEELGPAKKK